MRNRSLAFYGLFAAFLFVVATWSSAQQRTHTVLAGETLYSIARFYEVAIDELRKTNNLGDNRLSVGQVLRIPAASGAPVPTTPSPQAPAPAEAVSTASPAVHVVQRGETMFSIASRYGLKADELRVLNGLPGNALSIGDTLWVKQPPVTVRAEQAPAASVSMSAPAARFHTVAKGETLFRIAQLYNMPVTELVKLNQISGTELAVGQKLRILAPEQVPSVNEPEKSGAFGRFVAYTWKTADVLQDVLKSYGMDSLDWRALNPGLEKPQPDDAVVLFMRPPRRYANPYTASERTGGAMEAKHSFNVIQTDRVGRPLTSGILYSVDLLAIGHPVLQLGTIVRLSQTQGGKSIFAQVVERTPRDVYAVSKRVADFFGAEGTSIGLNVSVVTE